MTEGGQRRHDEVPSTDVEEERQARQRKRSIAIGLSLLFLAVLFYVVTLVKMGSALTEKAGS
jgi:hypothetical protein